jgi:hypothetical protein
MSERGEFVLTEELFEKLFAADPDDPFATMDLLQLGPLDLPTDAALAQLPGGTGGALREALDRLRKSAATSSRIQWRLWAFLDSVALWEAEPALARALYERALLERPLPEQDAGLAVFLCDLVARMPQSLATERAIGRIRTVGSFSTAPPGVPLDGEEEAFTGAAGDGQP